MRILNKWLDNKIDERLRSEERYLSDMAFLKKRSDDIVQYSVDTQNKINKILQKVDAYLNHHIAAANKKVLDELESKAIATKFSDGKGGIQFAIPVEAIKAVRGQK